ncbi:MAG: 16S rRNA (uracil(1498)-N(3))-methyltransferase [Hyphomicrobiales bacterium]|nr:16S rRNA (uracil(1498)-N(3))-methyltransferase [Rickettsiales bacterium]MCP5362218.1 16S rRNA (uracil(1498)-N(3))-methyltransferase [Hyphomicrobiales bacterium]
MAYVRKIRVFVPSSLCAGASVLLELSQAHYLCHVMRLKVSDRFLIFNGKDGEWEASLTEVGKKHASAMAERAVRAQVDESDIRLLFAPLKHGPLDFLVQKATELGASVLQPVLTERTVVRRINAERMQSQVQEAAEQCERLTVPECKPLLELSEVLSAWPIDTPLLFCDEARQDQGILRVLAAEPQRFHGAGILIGPEGGFSDHEVEMIRSQPYVVPVSLGTRVLRAETAALAALACWQGVMER